MNFIDALKRLIKKEVYVNQATVLKKNGEWWFFGIYSNKFMDRDGEILSEKSHKEYIDWLNKTGFRPVITAYHLPRAKDPAFWTKVFEFFEDRPVVLQKIVDDFYKPVAFAKVDRVIYANGFTAVMAKFFPDKADVAMRLSQMENMGMSHGFINKESGANIFYKYRSFEMSVLRSVRAANLFTVASALASKGEKEMAGKDKEKTLTAEDREALARLFPDEAIDKFESSTEKDASILMRYLAHKASDEDEDEEDDEEEMPMKEESSKEDAQKEEELPVDLTVQAVAKATADTFVELQKVIAEMQQKSVEQAEKIVALEAQLAQSKEVVEELKKSDDEKIASHWLPALDWRSGFSASESSKNVIKKKEEKEEITENAPTGDHPQPKNKVMSYALAPLFTRGLQG